MFTTFVIANTQSQVNGDSQLTLNILLSAVLQLLLMKLTVL